MSHQHYDDPVAAYDRLAPVYWGYAKRRERYLLSVERLIAHRVQGATSLLDMGAGDGTRATRIAATAGIPNLVLLEPSSAMSGTPTSSAERWAMRAEDLRPEHMARRFDAITCLWNVLGHIPAIDRERVLRASSQLLTPEGRIFLDVNHRYNARSYGWIATSARWLRDAVTQDVRKGDVTAIWKIGGGRSISTFGHVFTHREMVGLAQAAGVEIEERIVIDYENGSVHDITWLGNLLYIFRRSSRTDSSNAPTTS